MILGNNGNITFFNNLQKKKYFASPSQNANGFFKEFYQKHKTVPEINHET